MNNFKEFEYVKKLFDENKKHREEYSFRDKLEHTKRVYVWANRLLEHEEANKEVVLTAAIFHDVGYIYSGKEHPKYSAEICREYMQNAKYENQFIDKVAGIVANHGNKELLNDPNASKEQILLIEADCLDESGTLSILRDALSEGTKSEVSYNNVYKRLCERSIVKRPNSFYCVTNTAKKFWTEKQRLYIKFLDNLKSDLDGFDRYLIR